MIDAKERAALIVRHWTDEQKEWLFEECRAARDETLEECARIAADHAEFCHTEAHNGGSRDLYERASGAAYLRDKFRSMKGPK